DRYLARYEGKFGVFHASGVEILPLQYDWMYDLGDGLFEARLGDTRGLLDIDGNWRISFSDYEVLVD
ncbi:MAG: hypothetical protein GX592_14470, partial [Clostridiales bacterium]|nr:hypothetical protein [Clostridiales bacterium]